MDFNLIPDRTDPAIVTDGIIRNFLEERSKTTKTTISLSSVNSIVERALIIVESDTSALTRIENLFTSYLSILRRHGLQWVTNARLKTAITDIIVNVNTKSLRTKLESNMEFSHMGLQKDFNVFFQHAVKVYESFEDIDIGPIARSSNPRHRREGKSSSSEKNAGCPEIENEGIDQRNLRSRNRPLPPCPHPICKKKEALHWINDYGLFSEEKKRGLKAELAANVVIWVSRHLVNIVQLYTCMIIDMHQLPHSCTRGLAK